MVWCSTGVVPEWCSCGGVFVSVFLWWRGGVVVFCGDVFVVVFLWWCSCGGVFVVVFLWWCSCGGVVGVVFLSFCDGVFVCFFSRKRPRRVLSKKALPLRTVIKDCPKFC